MSNDIYARLMSVVSEIEQDGFVSLGPVAPLIRDLDGLADRHLAATCSAEDIRTGIMAKLAAIELDPASHAIESAMATGRGPKTVGVMTAIARRKLVAACGHALELPEDIELPRPADKKTIPAVTSGAAKGAPTIGVLRNIAAYHREHERYYTWNSATEAANMFREANRLKAVATVWLGDQSSPSLHLAAGDFTDERFAAAGCNDLNALPAIGAIGVLFMEGEGEPAEIRALKAKLRGLGPAWHGSGDWLANKMAHAWLRESVMLRDDWAAAAEPRFGTIVANWCGSRQMALAGRCATIALQILEGIDLRPAGVRADRREAGRQLLEAAWVLDGVAQVIGRSALDLSENDRRWTRYLDFLTTLPAVEAAA
ncbi:MAG: hypothetical protein JSR91_01375 [Proteobacteria bacterium]|nr:hypothetical protein [Pseudomonadota bacterium]